MQVTINEQQIPVDFTHMRNLEEALVELHDRFLPQGQQLFQVLVVDSVRHRNHAFVETIVPGLAASDQENGGPSRIEGIEDSVRVAAVLNSKLPHIAVPRTIDVGGVRKGERRSERFQQTD